MLTQGIKMAMRRTAAWCYYAAGGHRSSHLGKALILTYHRVLTPDELSNGYVQPGMYVLDSVFDRHLGFLKRHYTVVSLDELVERWGEKRLPTGMRYCAITLDDGWADNYKNAFPILKKHGIPATIFLPTALIGTTAWFWPERLCYLLGRVSASGTPAGGQGRVLEMLSTLTGMPGRELGVGGTEYAAAPGEVDDLDRHIERLKKVSEKDREMVLQEIEAMAGAEPPGTRILLTWDEVREMSAHGISFGSHSRTHRILTQVPTKDAEEEIRDSRDELLGQRVRFSPVFCYPNGDFDETVQQIVRKCGYHAAVGTRFGFENEVPHDLFGLSRILVHNDISSTSPLFAFHLSGAIK